MFKLLVMFLSVRLNHIEPRLPRLTDARCLLSSSSCFLGLTGTAAEVLINAQTRKQTCTQQTRVVPPTRRVLIVTMDFSFPFFFLLLLCKYPATCHLPEPCPHLCLCLPYGSLIIIITGTDWMGGMHSEDFNGNKWAAEFWDALYHSVCCLCFKITL